MSINGHVIAVASGKGGVGKSTISVNLALALKMLGFKVGLLDADVYGPSQKLMLGVDDGTKPQQNDEGFLIPVDAHGIKTMSAAYLVDERTPMLWRGPMAAGALTQMLEQTLWGELDFLLIDMPPGTGDIQLTLAQKAQVSGAVIVTTPQNIALLDARKGIEMFRKVDIPILGVIENMSIHLCSNCGHKEHVFGSDGGDRIAREYDVPVLAALPLTSSIRELSDSGCPIVAADPESEISSLFFQAAKSIPDAIDELNEQEGTTAPEIIFSDD